MASPWPRAWRDTSAALHTAWFWFAEIVLVPAVGAGCGVALATAVSPGEAAVIGGLVAIGTALGLAMLVLLWNIFRAPYRLLAEAQTASERQIARTQVDTNRGEIRASLANIRLMGIALARQWRKCERLGAQQPIDETNQWRGDAWYTISMNQGETEAARFETDHLLPIEHDTNPASVRWPEMVGAIEARCQVLQEMINKQK